MEVLSLIASTGGLLVTIYLAFYFHKIKIDKVHENTLKLLSAVGHQENIIPMPFLRVISDIIDERNVSLQTEVAWDKIEKKEMTDDYQSLLETHYNITNSAYERIADYKVPWDHALTVKNFFLDFNRKHIEKAAQEFHQQYRKKRFKTKNDVKQFLQNKSNSLSENFHKFLDELEEI